MLDVTDIRTRFHTADGVVHAVNGVGFRLHEGELLGVVGESGSGKSVTMLSMLGLLPTPPAEVVGGQALLGDVDVMRMDGDSLREVRGGRIGFVFQDPMTSLNPVLTVGHQIAEPLRIHLGYAKAQAWRRAAELLERVGIPSPGRRLREYPHQFSGGMRQRVMIAIALACDPEVLVADEPTTALDVTVQAQILDLVRQLRRDLGMAIVWITHDLGVVAGLADRVMVMYAGQVVECADVQALYLRPRHPYTQGLLATLPRLDSAPGPASESAGAENVEQQRLPSIPGQPPSLLAPVNACPFAPRCPHAFHRCHRENPPLLPVGSGHEAACWLEAAP